MREAAIVRQIEQAVKLAYSDVWVRKLADRFTRGLPDLVIVLRGWTIFVEVKRPQGRLAKLQAANRDAVRQLGVPWLVVTSAQEVLNAIEAGEGACSRSNG